MGYFAFGIEVEGLVHDAVEIGDAVVGLDLERLGVLEAGGQERRDVGRFELEEEVPGRVAELRLRGRVDPGEVVDEEAGRIVHGCRVRGVALVELPQARAVEADPVEVGVVGVLAGLPAAGQEVEGAGLLVDLHDALADELARGQLGLELAVAVVEVVVAPAVALGPPQHLFAAAEEPQVLVFDVGVQALLDEDLDLARGRVGDAGLEAVEVARLAAEIELVGRVGEPLGGGRELLLPVEGSARGREDVEGRVLELLRLDLDLGLGGQVEDQDLGLGLVLLAGHLVAVGLEGRPGIGQGVDDPEVGDLALVAADEGDLLGILGPDDHPGRGAEVLAVLLVLLELFLVLVVEIPGVAVVLLAVGRQLDLLDGLVVGLLLGQLEALGVHQEQVLAAGEDDRLLVGRDRGPAGPLLGGLVVLEERQLAGRQLVSEAQDLGLLLRLLGLVGLLALVLLGVLLLLLVLLLVDLLDLLLLLGDLGGLDDLAADQDVVVLGHLDLELEGRVLLDELDGLDRQVLGVVGDEEDAGQLGGHLDVVEEGASSVRAAGSTIYQARPRAVS